MITRFANLLRSHDHSDALITWKNQILTEEFKRPESLDIASTTFEYQHYQRDYAQVSITSNDISKLFRENTTTLKNTESHKNAQKLLLTAANNMQKIIIKNKNATKIADLSLTLASIYSAFIDIVESSDKRIPSAHYNLAETFFEIKEFDNATIHYRWIVDNWKKSMAGDISLETASIRAISSRYEILRKDNLIPGNINAVALSKNSSSDTNNKLEEIIKWIDVYMDEFAADDKTINNFAFETNRALYAQNKIVSAMERLDDFAVNNPKSKFAQPSAGLVLDTYVASQDWENAHKTATKYLNVSQWNGAQFHERVFSIAADSYFKIIEKLYADNQYKESMNKCDTFLDKYRKSARLEDVLFIAGKAALQLKKEDKAETFLMELIKSFPASQNTSAALLITAAQKEKKYDFRSAVGFYMSHLNLINKKDKTDKSELMDSNKIREKILYLSWLSGDSKLITSSIKSGSICIAEIKNSCDKYTAILAAQNNESLNKSDIKDITNRAIHGPKEFRPLWAVAALKNLDKHGFSDRLSLVRTISNGWNSIDPLVQFAILPELNKSIPQVFIANRKDMQIYSKLTGSESSIKRRVNLIQEMESTASSVVKTIPWSSIRAQVLNEVAELYQDFANAINVLPEPKGISEAELASYRETIQKITLPFEEKGQQIRNNAFMMASMSSIEKPAFDRIAEGFFKYNPSQAKATAGDFPPPQAMPISYQLVQELSIDGDWDKSVENIWQDALKKGNWQFIAFLIRENKERKWAPEKAERILQAVALYQAGAKAEALAELSEARGDLEKTIKNRLTIILISHHLSTYSKKTTRQYVEELEEGCAGWSLTDPIANDEEAFMIAYASRWSEAKISEANTDAVLKKATGSSVEEQTLWAQKQIKEIIANRKIASN